MCYFMSDCLNSIRVFIRDLIGGIGNIIRFFKVIYNYRWWDHSFLLQVLIAMLKYNSKQFKLHGHAVLSNKRSKELAIMASCLEHINGEELDSPFAKELYQNLSMHTVPIENSDFLNLKFNYGKFTEKDFKRLRDKESKREANQKKFFMDLFIKYFKRIDHYWD